MVKVFRLDYWGMNSIQHNFVDEYRVLVVYMVTEECRLSWKKGFEEWQTCTEMADSLPSFIG
ncbi:hypothetical protein KXD40_009323 [Peronospora effusa]|uniref:Uncharacterized protein n=1 Tax=Peronospora effusa TaxID=542832 RepID=A0A3M6VLU2_9STRA|nr:hypothetical protein DD238_003046 [Peronospora effusa]RQM14632.1 hypothetical protein DD237_005778 [Peronospora effusa]UIZ28601.1 hypothetical protein KXD40_009323 [Peronospora effusa]